MMRAEAVFEITGRGQTTADESPSATRGRARVTARLHLDAQGTHRIVFDYELG